MAEPVPLILNDASLKISKSALTADLTELGCVTNHIEISPDTSITTLDTLCGSRDYPGITKWSLVCTLYQSFDPDATEEVLSAAVATGDAVPFEVLGYKSQPVSVTNPKWSGMAIPQPYSPLNGDAGDASEVELEWSLTAAPAKSIGVKATGAVAGIPGYFTGGDIPADLAALSAAPAVVASPATAWTTGQYVTTADSIQAHWNGTAWATAPALMEAEAETRKK
jgi:hypothetical protein